MAAEEEEREVWFRDAPVTKKCSFISKYVKIQDASIRADDRRRQGSDQPTKVCIELSIIIKK